MTQYKTIGKVIQPPFQVDGYKACPFCGGIELHYPTSTIHNLPFPNGPVTMDNSRFPSYSSYYCLACTRSFEVPAFKPDISGMTPESQGTLNAGF
jgi:hypothetical protein